MAELMIDADTVTVRLSGAERIEAFHGDVTVPRSAITGVRVVPDGMSELHGLRAPGTSLPRVVMVGTWREREATTFAVCHGERPALVLELAGAPYDRLVVTVDDPEILARALA